MAENTASYLTVLLTDNENLKNWLTNYLNVRKSLAATYKNSQEDLSNLLKPEEKKQMVDTISMFVAFATRIKISINVLMSKFPEEVRAQIEEDYKHIEENTIPKYEVCKRFVQNINDMLGEQLNVAATFSSK